MKFDRNLAMVLLALALILAPALAEARAGGSMRMGGMGYQSQGSRGMRTYNYDGAQPLQRSITPEPMAPAYYGGGSFWNRHPFLSAMAGGFFGAWIGHLLFPGWGFGGLFAGSIFSWILIIFLISALFRNFRHHLVPSGDAAAYYQPATYQPTITSMPAYQGSGAPLSLAAPDYTEFEQVLKAVQAAWSNADLQGLRRLVTPEMLAYFAEELANNTSQGVQNRVEQVTLLNGDLREAWDEAQLQYATAHLRWSAVDYTLRTDRGPGDADAVVEGDPLHPVIAEEMWTFARAHGGHWLLSAIQQV